MYYQTYYFNYHDTHIQGTTHISRLKTASDTIIPHKKYIAEGFPKHSKLFTYCNPIKLKKRGHTNESIWILQN